MKTEKLMENSKNEIGKNALFFEPENQIVEKKNNQHMIGSQKN